MWFKNSRGTLKIQQEQRAGINTKVPLPYQDASSRKWETVCHYASGSRRCYQKLSSCAHLCKQEARLSIQPGFSTDVLQFGGGAYRSTTTLCSHNKGDGGVHERSYSIRTTYGSRCQSSFSSSFSTRIENIGHGRGDYRGWRKIGLDKVGTFSDARVDAMYWNGKFLIIQFHQVDLIPPEEYGKLALIFENPEFVVKQSTRAGEQDITKPHVELPVLLIVWESEVKHIDNKESWFFYGECEEDQPYVIWYINVACSPTLLASPSWLAEAPDCGHSPLLQCGSFPVQLGA